VVQLLRLKVLTQCRGEGIGHPLIDWPQPDVVGQHGDRTSLFAGMHPCGHIFVDNPCNHMFAGNKEKVMRIALLTLSRLLEESNEHIQLQLIESGLPRIVRIRSAQSFADEDVPVLLEKLDEALSTRVVAMSNFDRYRVEALAGVLEWGPMHSNMQFWQVRRPLLCAAAVVVLL
jgi:hypothetical protein